MMDEIYREAVSHRDNCQNIVDPEESIGKRSETRLSTKCIDQWRW
jgi:hypothetical protein